MSKQHKHQLRLSKYNPEMSERVAAKHLLGVSKDEYAAWLDHPCSKALHYTLEASLDNLVQTWVRGGYGGDTTDQLAMSQAKATGYAEALEWVKVHISEMVDTTHSEEVEDESRNSSGW